MANTFKSNAHDGSSTVANTVTTLYNVPTATTTVVIGLALANTSQDLIFVNVKVNKSGGDEIYFAKDIPIPGGSTIEIMTGNKIVLEDSDSVKVSSSESNSLDTLLSYMEQS